MNTKSLLISALALFSLANVSAQELQFVDGGLPPVSLRQLGRADAFVDASENVYWGYCGETIDNALNVGRVAELGGAIFVPAEELAAFKGSMIVGVRVGMYKEACTDGKIFFMSSLSPEKVTYSQKVGDMPAGWTEYELTEPQKIADEDFYVGFKATGTAPIGTSSVVNSNAMFVFDSQSWSDQSAQFPGSCCVQLVISASNVLEREMSLSLNSSALNAGIGESYKVSGTVANKTTATVNSYEITCSVDGEDNPVTKSFTTDLALGEAENFEVEMPAFAEEGERKLTVTISKVNGGEDEYSANSTAEKSVIVIAETYPRVSVLEEATGTWCGWCPRGIVAIKEMKAKYPDRFIGIAVHFNDALQSNSYLKLLQYYQVPGAPYGIVNRTYGTDPNFEALEEIMSLTPENATKKVNVEAAFTEDKKSIEVKTTTTFGYSTSDPSVQIAVALIENDVTGYRQTNNYAGGAYGEMGGFESKPASVPIDMNEVARGIWDTFQGIKGSIPETVESKTPYEYSYTISASSFDVKNTANLEVIAMLLNTETGEIENAASAKVTGGEASVDSVVAETLVYAENGRICTNTENADIQVWNLAGALVPNENLPGGVYIVKVTDENGTVVRKIGM